MILDTGFRMLDTGCMKAIHAVGIQNLKYPGTSIQQPKGKGV
jgi:hypothetical protein